MRHHIDSDAHDPYSIANYAAETAKTRTSGPASRLVVGIRCREGQGEIAGLERVLVRREGRIVRRRRDVEARRQPAVEQARRLQFLETRQVGDAVEAEMVEEGGS